MEAEQLLRQQQKGLAEALRSGSPVHTRLSKCSFISALVAVESVSN
jgi:hypothetical protein